jgi:cell division septum initiation protein DivIVA
LGERDLKDLEKKFSEVEKRVKAIVTENHALRSRIKELDKEIKQARREVHSSELFQGKQLQVREKIERVLKTLDALAEKRGTTD